MFKLITKGRKKEAEVQERETGRRSGRRSLSKSFSRVQQCIVALEGTFLLVRLPVNLKEILNRNELFSR